jgi:glycerophosphoryl diester phosphodiesterase
MLRLDLENKKIYKNEFVFALDYEIRADKIFIESKTAEAVFNVNLILIGSRVVRTEPVKYDAHAWTDMCKGLIAHAGGTVILGGDTKPAYGTNSRTAVIYSYNHGHRVFEIDFNLTTDNKLAAVHNWHGYKGPMSSEEWAEVKIWQAFASMMLEDVLDIMLVNKDMFLVTDTKSFEYTREQTELQFKIIVEAAKKKDPELLERIIPQIYYQEMYDIVMAQHNFKSMIYTLYASTDSDAQVLDFVSKHNNIRVVTMAPVRGSPEFIGTLRRLGKHIYYFTINDAQEILDYKKDGVRGFYTDFIFPRDLNNK